MQKLRELNKRSRKYMNCKDCKFIKCYLRTEKAFEKCPVDIKKEEFEEHKEFEK